jgi:regulator of sigma E protease
MNLIEQFQVLGGSVWLYGGAFILVLGVLVFVHEWGHYIVARLCGIRVESFSLGFGKELIGFNDRNGTRWKLSAVPLGGYVKLFGDTDPASAGSTDQVDGGEGQAPRTMTEAERGQAFFAQPVWKRALVVVAGPAINYLFAFAVMAGLFCLNGQPITPPSAAAVIEGSSADKSGFRPHDVVVSIDGKAIATFEDIRREMMISLDAERHFVVRRGEKELDIYATPEKLTQEDRFGFKHSVGLLGLISPRHALKVDSIESLNGRTYADQDELIKALSKSMDKTVVLKIKGDKDEKGLKAQPMAEYNADLAKPESEEYGVLFLSDVEASQFVRHPLPVAAMRALEQCWVVTTGTIEALGQMVTGTRSASELGGVIRIGAMAGDMAQQGMVALIMFTALLSINLGLINLFPIPMLDGGHLVFYALETVMGRPVPERVQEYAFRVGLAFLVGVMVFANLNDLIQLLL